MTEKTEAQANNSPLQTEQQAAEYLGLKPATLAAWRCTKRVEGPRYVKLGGSVRYPKVELDKFIARSLVGAE